MAEGKRPGGLTALAVLNFVFGGFSVLGVFGILAAIAVVKTAESGLHDIAVENGAKITEVQHVSVGILYVTLLLTALSALLLITSGVGYIKQKAFLGRTLGNGYAVVSLAGTIIGIALAHSGFGIGTIIFSVYPIVTLFLLNNTFKEDLVN